MDSISEPLGISAREFGWTHAGRIKPALRRVNLDIQPGERVLICGDSGSGKSTLMAALAGVLGGDDEGAAEGCLDLITGTGAHEPGSGVPVGLVLQDPDSQVIAASVGRDVAFGCENLGLERTEIWRRVEESLSLVGLDLPVDYPTAKLSGGQKQRLALAGVMAMGAGLILLDEPTANLDPQGARTVIAAVQRVVKATGATLVVVEHQYSQWEGLLDRAIVLEKGAVLDDADFATVVSSRQLGGLPVAEETTSSPDLWSEELLTRFGPPRNCEIPAGCSTVITGENGSGKTTWLMTMAGLLPKVSGDIGVAERVRRGAKGEPSEWTSRVLAERIGFVFQNPEHQFVARSVVEEMRIAPRIAYRALHEKRWWQKVSHAAQKGIDGGVDKRIAELLERLRLTDLADANPFTLSGGEKRRLSVATALVAAPSVVLLDEPTFGQDPTTFGELVTMLRELADSGVTIASITHDPNFIAALGDKKIHFKKGSTGA